MLIDVFRNDVFSTMSMTRAVERNPYVPDGIGSLNIFAEMPVSTRTVMVEIRNGRLVIIPTSPLGAPPTERVTEKRNAKAFLTQRLAHGDTIRAEEIDSIRAFGSETELELAQAEIARRLSGPTGLQASLHYTWERHRLGAIQGILLDADGTVIYNFFQEFGIAPNPEIGFDLTNPAPVEGALRKKVNTFVRQLARASMGAWTPSTRAYALCGDYFFDQLVAHPDVVKTYYNQAQAAELRDQQAFESTDFGGVTWVNYRGSDDNSAIAIAPDKVKFFPVGAPGVFQVAWGPGESFDTVNRPGRPMFVMIIYDEARNMFVRPEVYSYPLFMCTRPDLLFSGRVEA